MALIAIQDPTGLFIARSLASHFSATASHLRANPVNNPRTDLYRNADIKKITVNHPK